MSWESSVEYERVMNEAVRERLGTTHSADLIVRSYDFAEIETLQESGGWDALGERLASDARSLEAAGAQLLVIATNTMHVVAEQVQAAVDIPLVHIADATAAAVLAAGLDTVALLGTRYTMELPFYRDRLAAAGITALIPDEPDRTLVHDVIYRELVRGIVSDESRAAYLAVIGTAAGRRGAGRHRGLHRDRAARLGGRPRLPAVPDRATARARRRGRGARRVGGSSYDDVFARSWNHATVRAMPSAIGVGLRPNSRSIALESTTNGSVNSYSISSDSRATGMKSAPIRIVSGPMAPTFSGSPAAANAGRKRFATGERGCVREVPDPPERRVVRAKRRERRGRRPRCRRRSAACQRSRRARPSCRRPAARTPSIPSPSRSRRGRSSRPPDRSRPRARRAR